MAEVDHVTLSNAFPFSPMGPTQIWYFRLSPGLVNDFEKLRQLFVMQFLNSRAIKQGYAYLCTIQPSLNETLKSYLERFDHSVLECPIPKDSIILVVH